MFTGLIEETGKVISFKEEGDAWKLILEAPNIGQSLAIGDSLACNGCCLTVVANESGVLTFDLLEESIRLTSFQEAGPGSLINLERSLIADGRLGGHFVTGHVDVTGEISVFEQRGKNFYLRLSFPDRFSHYVVYKGSIAIDGISLTVAESEGNELSVWLIPHTLKATNLQQRKVGECVNLEFDLLAKYVEKQVLHEGKRDA